MKPCNFSLVRVTSCVISVCSYQALYMLQCWLHMHVSACGPLPLLSVVATGGDSNIQFILKAPYSRVTVPEPPHARPGPAHTRARTYSSAKPRRRWNHSVHISVGETVWPDMTWTVVAYKHKKQNETKNTLSSDFVLYFITLIVLQLYIVKCDCTYSNAKVWLCLDRPTLLYYVTLCHCMWALCCSYLSPVEWPSL